MKKLIIALMISSTISTNYVSSKDSVINFLGKNNTAIHNFNMYTTQLEYDLKKIESMYELKPIPKIINEVKRVATENNIKLDTKDYFTTTILTIYKEGENSISNIETLIQIALLTRNALQTLVSPLKNSNIRNLSNLRQVVSNANDTMFEIAEWLKTIKYILENETKRNNNNKPITSKDFLHFIKENENSDDVKKFNTRLTNILKNIDKLKKSLSNLNIKNIPEEITRRLSLEKFVNLVNPILIASGWDAINIY